MPNLHDPFMQFLVNNALVIIFGVIATILAAWAIIQARSKKELSYEIVSEAPVVSVDENMANRVKILLDGKEIEEPYLTVIKFTNSGNKAIVENDFVDPITIDFKGSQVVSAEIIEINRKRYFGKTQDKANFIQWKGSEATLRKIFLNPRDYFFISALTEKKAYDIDVNTTIIEGALKYKRDNFMSWATSALIFFIVTGLLLLVFTALIDPHDLTFPFVTQIITTEFTASLVFILILRTKLRR